MSMPRFIHSGGEILLDGARLSLVMAEDMRLIFEDEQKSADMACIRFVRAPRSEPFKAAAREQERMMALRADLETAMEAARQWHAAARGVAR